MAIYKISDGRLDKIDRTTFKSQGIKERQDLQQMLKTQIDVICPDTLVVAEEFSDWDGSSLRIDLLGIDKQANLIVIELKRSEHGDHMELQALRYAAMISTMTFERLVVIFKRYIEGNDLKRNAEKDLLEFLGWDEPDEKQFAQEVKIVLASAEFSKELTTSVTWLNDVYGLNIQCVRMQPYQDGADTLIDVQTIIPLPEVADYQIKISQKKQKERKIRPEWSGYYFVNAGLGNERSWVDMKRYGFVGACGGEYYTKMLKQLKLGEKLFAYDKGNGYIGYGLVNKERVLASKFGTPDGLLFAQTLDQPGIQNNAEDLSKAEYVVGVDWQKTFEPDQAKKFTGIFANPNIVCKLRDQATVDFLIEEFGVEVI